MILKMYALKDELNGFTPVIPFTSDELAKRYLKDQYESNPTVKNTPADFSIWYIASYDTDTGILSQSDQPTLVERASSYGN